MTTSNIQIHVYSYQKANRIAEVLKEYSPLVEDWTGEDDGSWPIAPLYAVFLTVPETEIINDEGRAVATILDAVEDCNATIYVEDDLNLKGQPPATVEEHCQWCEMSINDYQYIFPFRKCHVHAEKLSCSLCNNLEWYSLPEGHEKARRECPYCEKARIIGYDKEGEEVNDDG